MAVDRIGGLGRVGRDAPSAGFDALDQKTPAEDTAKPERNAKVDEVAKLYEKQFLREMVKAMRGTVNFGAEKPSMAENIYRDELDQQYVESWGENGGVGLSDLIYEQIMEKFFATAAGQELKSQNKGQGIPLTDRDVSRVIRMKTQTPGGNQVPLRVETKPSADGTSGKILAPWDGQVVAKARIEGGKTALTLAHGPKLRSTFVFQGVAGADVQPGAKLSQGSQVATLSPEIHSFLWNLNQSAERALDPGPARSN